MARLTLYRPNSTQIIIDNITVTHQEGQILHYIDQNVEVSTTLPYVVEDSKPEIYRY